MAEEIQAEAAKLRGVESEIATELGLRTPPLTDDQHETEEEPLPPIKRARARKTTEEK